MGCLMRMMILAAIFITLTATILPHIIWLLTAVIGSIAGFRVKYSPFGWTAAVMCILSWSVLAYGYFIGRLKLETKTFEYSHRGIPTSFDGYRIVHISDLHLSTFDDRKEKFTEIVNTINSLKPDLVCFTGDLVNTEARETYPYLDDMSSIKATDGIISILGNHDFMLYSLSKRTQEERERDVELLVETQERVGWKVLRNENIAISRGSETIHILGVDNHSCSGQGFQTVSNGDLHKAMEGSENFRILLSHDPSHWAGEVLHHTDIPLTLSGHTHAAQIRLFGWTPASWMFDYTDGRYDVDGQTLHINIGLGCTAPFRLGATPEITLITLRYSPEEFL